VDNLDILIIDFEYSGISYRGYDIGNHFCEWMADYHCDKPHELDPKRYPSKKEQLAFLSSYVAAYEAHDQVTLSEDERERLVHGLYLEANKYGLMSHVVWGLWGLLQSINSTIQFDYFAYGMQRLWMFHDLRPKMEAL
jgi:thiamine kinase-like enzyme